MSTVLSGEYYEIKMSAYARESHIFQVTVSFNLTSVLVK